MSRHRPLMFVALAVGLLLGAAHARASEVELLDAGQEPRQRITLTPEVGSKQRVEVSGSSDSTVEVSLLPDPDATSQTSRTVVELEVLEVGAAGAVTARVAVLEARTDGQRKAKRGGPQSMEGRTGTMTVEPSGAMRSFDESAAPDGRLADLARQLATPFPSEPIGPGARWRVAAPLDLDVVQVRLVTVYELVDFDGETATVTSRLTAEVADAELTLDDASVRAELTELSTAGAATIVQSMAALAPARRDDAGHYVVGVEGRKGLMPFRLRLEIDATSRAVGFALPR